MFPWLCPLINPLGLRPQSWGQPAGPPSPRLRRGFARVWEPAAAVQASHGSQPSMESRRKAGSLFVVRRSARRERLRGNDRHSDRDTNAEKSDVLGRAEKKRSRRIAYNAFDEVEPYLDPLEFPRSLIKRVSAGAIRLLTERGHYEDAERPGKESRNKLGVSLVPAFLFGGT